MKIDMHAHCLPVSRCAHHEPELLPEMFRDGGMDGFVLTNHCYPNHCDPLGDTYPAQAEAYLDVYRRCRKKGDEIGIRVFFGAEIKLIHEPNHPEFLLYGLSEKDFLDSYPLYNCTQKELYDYCCARDILMVQAHPFRVEQGYAPADMRYVHGIEVYNPHLSFPPRFEEALQLARENGKRMTSGSDFHVKQQAGLAGLVLPDTIRDQFMLRDHLKKNPPVILCKDGVLYRED